MVIEIKKDLQKELFDLKEDEKEGEIKYDIKLFENIFTKKKTSKDFIRRKARINKNYYYFYLC